MGTYCHRSKPPKGDWRGTEKYQSHNNRDTMKIRVFAFCVKGYGSRNSSCHNLLPFESTMRPRPRPPMSRAAINVQSSSCIPIMMMKKMKNLYPYYLLEEYWNWIKIVFIIIMIISLSYKVAVEVEYLIHLISRF